MLEPVAPPATLYLGVGDDFDTKAGAGRKGPEFSGETLEKVGRAAGFRVVRLVAIIGRQIEQNRARLWRHEVPHDQAPADAQLGGLGGKTARSSFVIVAIE